MKINNETLTEWNELLDFGDKKELAKITNKSYPTILKALKGNCNESLMVQISTYFKEKKQRINQLNS